MILQKIFECNQCKSEIVKSENPKFTKSVVEECPVCGSTEVTLKESKVIGKRPNT